MARGYVKFSMELYDEDGRMVADMLGVPTIPGDIEIYAQVYALAPPGYGEPVVEVFRGSLTVGAPHSTPRAPSAG